MEWDKQCYDPAQMYLGIPKIVQADKSLNYPHYKFIRDSLSILMLLMVLTTKSHRELEALMHVEGKKFFSLDIVLKNK